MKKLLVLILVLGLANAASAVITYTPIGTVSGTNDDIEAVAGEVVYIDIWATGAADYLMSTGELLVTISGPAQFEFDSLDIMTYAPDQTWWYPDYGLIVNQIIDDPQNARVSAASVSTMEMFWMTMPDSPIGNIGVTYLGGDTATVTIVPNNNPNPWGNTVYVRIGIAYDDLEATGGSINIIPEPATIAFLGLGGLALLRRRGRGNGETVRR